MDCRSALRGFKSPSRLHTDFYPVTSQPVEFINPLTIRILVVVMLRVRVIGRRIEREVEWRRGMKVRDVLRELGFNTESAIAKVNGRVALEDENVKDGDYIEVIPVVSGG